MSGQISPEDLDEGSSEFLRAAREGDRKALEQLVEDQRAELLSIADHQIESDLRVKESPSDIVQQSMLEGIRGFERFKGRSTGDFRNYLQAILRNNLFDLRRRYLGSSKRSLLRETSSVDPDGQPDELTLTPSGMFATRDDARILEENLRKLPPEQERLLRLRFWDQLTFDQMAEILGQKADATRKGFCRALQALTRAVNGDLPRE